MGRVDLQRNRKNTKGAAILIDKNTFCEQIRLHKKAMYYLAFSLVQNEADAADVIGEAILRAYKNIDGLKSEKAFKPWLLKIIHNTAVEYIRKNAKTVSSQEMDIAVENYIETRLTLWQTVKSLKQPYRTVTILYYYKDNAQPGEKLGDFIDIISIDTFREEVLNLASLELQL